MTACSRRVTASGPMLQRIYGTAWENKDQLAEHLRLQAEAKRRDHRALGKQLNLFSIQQAAGGGLVFWHPKGAIMRNLMETYWKDAHLQVRSHPIRFPSDPIPFPSHPRPIPPHPRPIPPHSHPTPPHSRPVPSHPVPSRPTVGRLRAALHAAHGVG